MTEKTLTTENIRPALDALRGELAPWPVVAKKQDRLNTAQLNAANSGITSSLVAQIIANTAAIRALESAITGTGLRALVVASLPAVGTTGILYIVPVTTYDPDTDADVVNYSNEYIWIPVEGGQASEGHYEQVGQTGIVINNGQLTITVNGTSVGTFTANQSGDTTAAITVPTNADYVDRTTDQTVAGVKTFSSTINGTAAKAIADEDGTSIKTGYVNVAETQTVSGQKTWSSNQFFTSAVYHKSTTYEIGNFPASNIVTNIYFADKNNVYTGFTRNVTYASGRTAIEVRARNFFKNNALDPTGSEISSNLNVEVQPDGSKTLYFDSFIRNAVLPYATDTYNIGSTTNQWLRMYAKFYYYNGVAWGLDQNNTWTGSNTFSSILNQNINSIYSEVPASDHFAVKGVTDNNGNNVFVISFADRSSGQRDLTLRVYDTNGASEGVGLYKNSDNSSDFKPMSNALVNLGTSTNKWKTLNGINPGALGIPSSSYVAIDTTNWDLTGATSQSYTPTVHGWLFISIQNIAGNYLSVVGGRGAISIDGTGVQSGLRAMLPVIANESVAITVKTGSIFAARFYPMLGNV